MIFILDEFTLKKDLSVTNVLLYNDESMVELLFIILLPLTINELLKVVPFFYVVIPESFNETFNEY
jgi:hypothetical protein